METMAITATLRRLSRKVLFASFPEQVIRVNIYTQCSIHYNSDHPVPKKGRPADGSPKTPHVYRIFRVGGERHECYVGSTTGRADRRYQHLWHLRRQSHHFRRLQAAWEKYGADVFRYEVLEDIADMGTPRLRERH